MVLLLWWAIENNVLLLELFFQRMWVATDTTTRFPYIPIENIVNMIKIRNVTTWTYMNSSFFFCLERKQIAMKTVRSSPMENHLVLCLEERHKVYPNIFWVEGPKIFCLRRTTRSANIKYPRVFCRRGSLYMRLEWEGDCFASFWKSTMSVCRF